MSSFARPRTNNEVYPPRIIAPQPLLVSSKPAMQRVVEEEDEESEVDEVESVVSEVEGDEAPLVQEPGLETVEEVEEDEG